MEDCIVVSDTLWMIFLWMILIILNKFVHSHDTAKFSLSVVTLVRTLPLSYQNEIKQDFFR